MQLGLLSQWCGTSDCQLSYMERAPGSGCAILVQYLAVVVTPVAIDQKNKAMSVRMILLPVFAHVALVLFLLFSEARSRSNAAVGEPSWRAEVEIGVLFYILTLCAWNTQFADLLFIVLAWVFVVLRILGATGTTILDFPPSRTFMASAIVLTAMWIIYALRLLFAF